MLYQYIHNRNWINTTWANSALITENSSIDFITLSVNFLIAIEKTMLQLTDALLGWSISTFRKNRFLYQNLSNRLLNIEWQ